MSSSVKLYTTGNMEFVDFEGTQPTTPAAYPVQHILDNNLDTAFSPSGFATPQSVTLDAQGDITVDAIILWVQNYTDTFGSNSFSFLHSSDASSWTDTTDDKAVADTTTPLRIQELSSQTTDRYWRLTIPIISTTIQISGIWLCRLFEITQGNQWPQNDSIAFQNEVADIDNGRVFVTGKTRSQAEMFERTYRFIGTTFWGYLQSAFQDSAGRRWPLFIQESTGDSNARCVRFGQDELIENQRAYQIYVPTVRYITVPYIDDGYTY